MTAADIDRELMLRRLSSDRTRSRFLRCTAVALLVLLVDAWMAGDFELADITSERRIANLQRFVTQLAPYPLQGRPWDWATAFEWGGRILMTKGWSAAATTVAISIAAISLAGLAAAVLAFPATRTFAAAEPYLLHPRVPSRTVRAFWTGTVVVTRGLLIFLRAVPEYIWAFLLIAVVGPTPWAAVLALAIHNTGILAKLNAEAIENLEPQALASLRALGAGRRQIAFAGIIPSVIPRGLLFFFYRWETCVREATVLGMLGIVSLGYYVQDARARQQYDVMLAFVLLGSVVVLIGDLLSAAARETVRRSD